MRTQPWPSRRPRPHRSGSLVGALVVAPLLLGTPMVAQAATDPTPTTLTLTATLMHVAVEPVPHDEHDEHDEHGGLGEGDPQIDTFVHVGATMLEVPVDALPDGMRTGDPVTVTIEADRSITAAQAVQILADPGEDDEARIVDLAGAPADEPVAAAQEEPLAAAIDGTRPLTVLPVYWSAPDSATKASLTQLAGSTATYWSEQSDDRIVFKPAVRDWVRITDPGSCDTGQLLSRALAAHRVAMPADKQHVVVYFPRRADCGGWAGMASIGGGVSWLNGSQVADVMAHEIGHNLGLGHANTATCRTEGVRVSLSTKLSECSAVEYADRTDVMGIGTSMATGNLSTAFADYLGLAQVARPAPGATVTVDLSPLSSVAALRSIALPVEAGTVYVDFRPAAGRDTRVPDWAGVQVRLRTMNSGYPYPVTYLLDMNPESTTSFSSPALASGRSWAVPGTSQVVTVVSTGTTAQVRVSPAPVPEGGYQPVRPTRVHDARQVMAGGTVRCFAVAGTSSGVPVGAAGVVLNVATVAPTGPGHVVVYPDPGTTSQNAAPTTSTVNFEPGKDVANAAAVALPASGRVCYLIRGAHAGVVVDVTGYVLPDSAIYLRTPVRLDDRSGVQPGAPVTVQVTGRAGVPADATSVLLNVTAAGSVAPGNVRVYPAGAPRPATSTLNLSPAGDKSNAAIVQLSSGGALTYMTETGAGNRVRVVLDVVGYTSSGSGFVPVSPVRLLDTRSTGSLPAGERQTVTLSGATGIPDTASAVVINTVAVAPSSVGNLRVFPYQSGSTFVPAASTLNYIPGTDVANLVITGVGDDRKVVLYTDQSPGGRTHLVVDVVGYLTNQRS